MLWMRAFVDHNRRFGESQARVEVRAGRRGHAVGGPWSALRLEADVIGRMPVAGGEDGRPGVLRGLDPGIEDRHDGVAARHGQGTAGTEITLHVDDEQGVRRTAASAGSCNPTNLAAGVDGFEPPLHGPEPCVLPLDDTPVAGLSRVEGSTRN